MDNPYPYSTAFIQNYGCIQFGGTDLAVFAWPFGSGNDLFVTVQRSRVPIYSVSLRGAFTLWIPPAPQALIQQDVNLCGR